MDAQAAAVTVAAAVLLLHLNQLVQDLHWQCSLKLSDTSSAAISAIGTTVSLTWTDPAGDYTHVRIAWTTTPATSTATTPVDVAKGTGKATITGLSSDVEYVFTSRLVAGTGDSQSTSDPSAALMVTPVLRLRVALFSLGAQAGVFTGCPTDATGCTAQAGGGWRNGGADVVAAAGVSSSQVFWSMAYIADVTTSTG